MTAWPTSREWLNQNGFSLERRLCCRGTHCKMTIELWNTPSGRLMPLNVVGNDTNSLRPHWEVCIDEKEFRNKPKPEKISLKPVKEKPKSEPVPQTGRLF